MGHKTFTFMLKYEPLNITCLFSSGPYSVIQLQNTQITTNAVTLSWEQPEYKPLYLFLVLVSNATFNNVTVNPMYTVGGLLSGTNYSFTVTTQTADGTQAAPVTVSSFTRVYIQYQICSLQYY